MEDDRTPERGASMRRISTSLFALAATLSLGGSARAQALGLSPYVGPGFGAYAQPGGLYTSLSVPGMGRGGPSVMFYFPSNGSGSFTPSPMNYGMAGLQVPVVGTSGSVYVPTAMASAPLAVRGGLGLPAPARPAAATGPTRPAATRKAAAKADPEADPAPKARAGAA